MKRMTAMTLRQYRAYLGWSAAELARRAGLDAQTVRRVENGEPAFLHTVGAIVRALGEGMGKTLTIEEVEGLNIKD